MSSWRLIFCWPRWKRAIKRAPRGGGLCPSLLALVVLLAALAHPAAAQRLDGVNVIVARGHPFGSPSAQQALTRARELGAKAVAIVPFLWQPDPASPKLMRGADMTDEELRAAIRAAQTLSFKVVVKPHVWVEASWAGAVAPATDADWTAWFASYRAAIEAVAHIAAQEQADILVLGTELSKTVQRPEWNGLIASVRMIFPGRLTYVAHNVEEAETVPFWDRLDVIGVTLYPPLGDDRDREAHRAAMRKDADRLDALAARLAKPVLVGEIGIRSAQGAAAKPWESAEERHAKADPALQADVLADWLKILDRPAIAGVLIWRWFTDPAAGGPADTDFTVQGKPAEAALRCAWTGDCGG